MGPGFRQTVKELGAMGPAVIEGTSAGLAKGVKLAASHVSKNFLTGQALKRRTGNLARSIDGWMAQTLDGVVGIRDSAAVKKYAWMLTDEQKTITAKNAKALTIPIGEALTKSGVARFESVRQAAAELGVDIFRIKNVLGYKRGKKGKFRPLFVLVKSVFIQGSGALADGVMEKIDDITAEIQIEIDKRSGVA